MGNGPYPGLTMKLVDNFSLRLIKEPIPEKNLHGEYEVLIGGNTTGIHVPYCVIEAAVKVDAERYLIFLTNDTLFEEMLRIVLIHPGKGILECLVLGSVYLAGFFEELDVQASVIIFKFLGDKIWSVRIPDKPFFRIPFLGDPRGVWRPFALKHHILISANPLPARADGSR